MGRTVDFTWMRPIWLNGVGPSAGSLALRVGALLGELWLGQDLCSSLDSFYAEFGRRSAVLGPMSPAVLAEFFMHALPALLVKDLMDRREVPFPDVDSVMMALRNVVYRKFPSLTSCTGLMFLSTIATHYGPLGPRGWAVGGREAATSRVGAAVSVTD